MRTLRSTLLRRHYPGAKRIGVAVEGLHEVHRT